MNSFKIIIKVWSCNTQVQYNQTNRLKKEKDQSDKPRLQHKYQLKKQPRTTVCYKPIRQSLAKKLKTNLIQRHLWSKEDRQAKIIKITELRMSKKLSIKMSSGIGSLRLVTSRSCLFGITTEGIFLNFRLILAIKASARISGCRI